jgi:transglutaminase-like putative cysteine protease
MNNKSCFNREPQPPASRGIVRRLRSGALAALFMVASLISSPAARAGDAPSWMHALVNVPLPAHDEKTDAVLLYSEEILNVQPNGRIKEIDRAAYKILRPDGRQLGTTHFSYDGETRITNIHGWCIPAQGKDYEVRDKDTTERGYIDVDGGELYSDLHVKVMNIPASEPGNIIGYEVEHEDRPFIFQDEWVFQSRFPVREARYTLQLPAGWEYKAVWLNHAEVEPQSLGNNQWHWVVNEVPAIKPEREMPPYLGVAGQLLISIFAPGSVSSGRSFSTWSDMGRWYADLWKSRQDASPEIKQKVAELTKNSNSKLAQMQALARFTQNDVRYVAIELGIGGWQPHPASDVYVHRYGDCKDKSALLSTMLHEIGINSYHVAIHTTRGVVGPKVPPRLGIFNHAILAIQLPDGLEDASLISTITHPKLGRLLVFDPTDDMTPFGRLRGELQANYALLVTQDGGDLLRLPELPTKMNGIQRTAKLNLSGAGTLSGDVQEVRSGDRAASQRWALRTVTKDADRIKPIETLLSYSLGTYQITKASVSNMQVMDQPFVYNYSVVAQNYAKTAGDLLLVRPRVLGFKSSDILETREPRNYPVEFEGPLQDTDTFEITIPAGYEVDDLPAPVNAEYSFASYHSKTEAQGSVLRYTRTFEVKELSVPVSKVDELKKLYRIIASDERNTAVLKPAAH